MKRILQKYDEKRVHRALFCPIQMVVAVTLLPRPFSFVNPRNKEGKLQADFGTVCSSASFADKNSIFLCEKVSHFSPSKILHLKLQ